MKHYFLIFLAAVMSLGTLAPSAEARDRRHHSKKKFQRSERHHRSYHRGHHVRHSRREYRKGHYAWQNHHRYWVPARYVVVYY